MRTVQAQRRIKVTGFALFTAVFVVAACAGDDTPKPDPKLAAKSEAKLAPKAAGKVAAKPDVKSDTKPETKTDPKADAKSDAKAGVKSDTVAEKAPPACKVTEFGLSDQGIEVAPEVLIAAYSCAMGRTTYATSGHRLASLYPQWHRRDTAPFRSNLHDKRYVTVYANDRAIGEDDRKISELGIRPGSTVVTPNFSVKDDGNVEAGPLFILEKMPKGFNTRAGNWRYTVIGPEGDIVGVTQGQHADSIEFCKTCNRSSADEVYLALLRGEPPGPIGKRKRSLPKDPNQPDLSPLTPILDPEAPGAPPMPTMPVYDPLAPLPVAEPDSETPTAVLDPGKPSGVLDPKAPPMGVLDPKAPPMGVLDPKAPPMGVLDPKAPVLDPNAPVLDPNAPTPLTPTKPKKKAGLIAPTAPVLDPNAPVLDPNAPILDPKAPALEPDKPVAKKKLPLLDPDKPIASPDEPAAKDDEMLLDPDSPIGKQGL
jgi:hypothetical protein